MKKILFALLVTLFLIVSCAPQEQEEVKTQERDTEDTTKGKVQTTAEAPVTPGRILHLGIHTGQSRDLWVINSDGTGLEKVVNKYVDAKWSPDGELALYKYSVNLLVMNPKTTFKKEIVNAYDKLGMFEWSPDGKYVIFEEGGKIGAVNMDTYEENMPLASGESPAYAAKDTFAFISEKYIYRIGFEEKHDEKEEWLELSNPSLLKTSPSLMYMTFNDAGSFWIAPNEKDTDDLVEIADSNALEYAWSPDSKKIVYRTVNSKFHIYDRESKTTKTVTMHSQDHFAWSPDSKWIAFTNKDPETYEDIWMVRADGSGKFKFTDCPTACEKPSWGKE
ncbi:hypothetical protein KY312_01255 [Candidatus Woesearchaeota archaeon]|nr:hypothetical protein [Candidatus Woesearchaeota archaeon]